MFFLVLHFIGRDNVFTELVHLTSGGGNELRPFFSVFQMNSQ